MAILLNLLTIRALVFIIIIKCRHLYDGRLPCSSIADLAHIMGYVDTCAFSVDRVPLVDKRMPPSVGSTQLCPLSTSWLPWQQ